MRETIETDHEKKNWYRNTKRKHKRAMNGKHKKIQNKTDQTNEN